MTRSVVAAPLLAWTLVACASHVVLPPASRPSGVASLRLRPDELARLEGAPALAQRLRESPYAHFRFRHAEVTAAVCERFDDQRRHLPIVNLHGDAHVEQYAFTPTAQGLDDFDEAGFGPPVVDLVRFAASVHLVCALASFDCDAGHIVDAFLDRYDAAILAPDENVVVPSVVRRLREVAPTGRERFLAWAEAQMVPVRPDVAPRIEHAWSELAHMLAAVEPSRSAEFYALRRFGRLELGVGSALSTKYLLRIEGPTQAAEDDLIVEVKQREDVEQTACVQHPPTGGVLYPQVMQRRLGRIPRDVLAYVPHAQLEDGAPDGWMCWAHSWDPGHRELSWQDLENGDELLEVAVDVGAQLGSGHNRYVTAPLEDQHRFATRRAVHALRERIRSAARELADDAWRAWDEDRASL